MNKVKVEELFRRQLEYVKKYKLPEEVIEQLENIEQRITEIIKELEEFKRTYIISVEGNKKTLTKYGVNRWHIIDKIISYLQATRESIRYLLDVENKVK